MDLHCVGEPIRMKQLAIRGASLMTPALSEEDLKYVLGKLGVLAAFNDTEIHNTVGATS